MLRKQLSAIFGIGLALSAATQFAAPAQAVLHISESAGYSINWNGNDGANFNPAFPAPVPANLASTGNGTTPFSTSDLGPELGIPFHRAVNINDGQYGNANSWISASGDAVHAIGVSFNGLKSVTSVAWGRDNGNNVADCCGGQAADRTAGVYVLQRTTVGAPGAGTAVTGNAATGWETIGTFNYFGNADTVVGGGFTQWFRHEYDVAFNGAAVQATGFRLVVPQGGLGAGTAIDEFEAYSGNVNLGLNLVSVGAGPAVPANLALASNGSVAFAKDLIAGGAFAPTHTIPNLNDGIYGNSKSWIGDSNPTFAGVRLATPALIDSIAFGRDSGGEAQVFTDRDAGPYLIQYTLDPNAGLGTLEANWITIGSATIDPNDPSGHLRHLYSFAPVLATGVRIITQNPGAAIDEIEVFAAQVPEPATMSLLALGALGLLRRRRVQA